MSNSVSIRISVSRTLDPAEYFDVEYDGKKVRIERIQGGVIVHESGQITIGFSGAGHGYRKDGTLGDGVRNCYTLRRGHVPSDLEVGFRVEVLREIQALAARVNSPS